MPFRPNKTTKNPSQIGLVHKTGIRKVPGSINCVKLIKTCSRFYTIMKYICNASKLFWIIKTDWHSICNSIVHEKNNRFVKQKLKQKRNQRQIWRTKLKHAINFREKGTQKNENIKRERKYSPWSTQKGIKYWRAPNRNNLFD